MDDDLNTPKALAEFQRLRGDMNKMMSVGLSDQNKTTGLEEIFGSLGIYLVFLNVLQIEWQFEPPIKDN